MAKYIRYVGTGSLGGTILISQLIIEDDNGLVNYLNYFFDARKFSAMHYGRGGTFGEMKFNHNKLTITDEYAEYRDPIGTPYTDLYILINAVTDDVKLFIP